MWQNSRFRCMCCGDAFRKLQAGGVCGLCTKCCCNPRFGCYKGISREKVGGWMWQNSRFRCKDWAWDFYAKQGEGLRPNIDSWCNWVAPADPEPEKYPDLDAKIGLGIF